MGHTPFGYQIKNGKAVVDPEKRQQIRTVYASYLSGKSLMDAAKEAGLSMAHASAKRLLRNRTYLGTDFIHPSLMPKPFRKRPMRLTGGPGRLGGFITERKMSVNPAACFILRRRQNISMIHSGRQHTFTAQLRVRGDAWTI